MGFGLLKITSELITSNLRKGMTHHLEITDGLPRDAKVLNQSCTQYVTEVNIGLISTLYSGSPQYPTNVVVSVHNIGAPLFPPPLRLNPKEFINTLTTEEKEETYRYLNIVWGCRMR